MFPEELTGTGSFTSETERLGSLKNLNEQQDSTLSSQRCLFETLNASVVPCYLFEVCEEEGGYIFRTRQGSCFTISVEAIQ